MKNTLINLCVLILILFIGFGLGIYFEKSRYQPLPTQNTIPLELLEAERKRIDSLNIIISELSKNNDHLKDSVHEIEVIRIKEVNKVQSLPIDSAVLWFNLKLREYENN